MSGPSVSVVVVAYNMARELPRTLASLLPGMQLDVEMLDYEVIVVDNGSSTPVAFEHDCVRVMRIDNAARSPAHAVNVGLAAAQGELVGVFIDGARIASPGIVRNSILATQLDERPVIATVGFHIGPAGQQRSIRDGYNEPLEDELLNKVGWESDPYRLFEISAYALSAPTGWFGEIRESNALFMSSSMWSELNGYDERFRSAGGGYVNLDTFERAVALPGGQLVVLLGEATFHQVHGGTASNSAVDPGDVFAQEYRSIHGRSYAPPRLDPIFVGAFPDRMREPLFREEPHSDSGRHATGSLSPRRVPLRARARSVVWNAILRLPHGARTNPLFDADWYLRRYPDVPTRRSGAYRHYSRHGLSEGRDPNEFFRAAWYLKRNPDVAAMGIDPLDHYYLYGADEGRDPGPDFETNWYLSRYPDVAMSGVNPLEHYLRRGRHEGRQPSRNGHR